MSQRFGLSLFVIKRRFNSFINLTSVEVKLLMNGKSTLMQSVLLVDLFVRSIAGPSSFLSSVKLLTNRTFYNNGLVIGILDQNFVFSVSFLNDFIHSSAFFFFVLSTSKSQMSSKFALEMITWGSGTFFSRGKLKI